MTERGKAHNPYVAGAVIGGNRGFFGREDIFREVQRMLDSADERAIVLFGQRRIGKTSILLQLEKRLRKGGYLPIFFDLMDKARLPMRQVLFELAKKIAGELGLPDPVQERFDDEGCYLRQNYLPEVKALSSTPLVLLFDEFDVLDAPTAEKLEPTAAAKAFFPYLREWMAETSYARFVFVVGRKPEDLSTDFLATFKAARSKRVSVLARDDAVALITTAEREQSLIFVPEAVEAILDQTAGHPFLTQLLCQVLWDRIWDEEPDQTPEVGQADVEVAIPGALERGASQFQWIWDGLPPAEKVVMAAMAEAGRRTVTQDDLMRLLQTSGIRIIVRELELAPATLVGWELLRPVNGGYTYFIELVRRWVAEYYPLARVKDQIDRVDPLADSLYQTGQLFYRTRDLVNSSDQLRRALAINPNHFKARLLMGQILQEQGQLEAAIHEFETAYTYDPNGSRFALVRALLSQGGAYERSGDQDKALEIYDRVSEISPQDRVVSERVLGIRVKRDATVAIELEKAENWEEALVVYRRLAELQPQVVRWRESTERVLQNWVLAEQSKAIEYEKADRWSDALSIYHTLAELQPEVEQWHVSMSRSQEEEELANRFTEALAAIDRGYWQVAQRTIADVIYKRPDYGRDKLAAELLVEAVRSAALHKDAQPRVDVLSASQLQSEEPTLTQIDLKQLPVINVESAKNICQLGVFRQCKTYSPLALSSDGTQLAAAVDNNAIQVWDVHSGAELTKLTGHNMRVTSVAFEPGGTRLVSGSWDRTVRVWDSVIGKQVALFKGHKASVTSVAFGSVGLLVASASWDGTARVWDLNSGKQQAVYKGAKGVIGFISSTLASLTVEHWLKSVCFSPDGERIATVGNAGIISIWSVKTGKMLLKIDDAGTCFAFSPDGERLTDGRTVWNSNTGTKLTRIPAWPWNISFGSDGTQVAVVQLEANDIFVWNISANERSETSVQLTGHTAPVSSAVFSPDGRFIASNSEDGTIRFWGIVA